MTKPTEMPTFRELFVETLEVQNAIFDQCNGRKSVVMFMALGAGLYSVMDELQSHALETGLHDPQFLEFFNEALRSIKSVQKLSIKILSMTKDGMSLLEATEEIQKILEQISDDLTAEEFDAMCDELFNGKDTDDSDKS